MKGYDLLNGLNYIDDKYIAQAETETIVNPSYRRLRVIGSLAACFCILVAGALLLNTFLGRIPNHSSDGAAPEQLNKPTHIAGTMDNIYDGDADGAADTDALIPLSEVQYLRVHGTYTPLLYSGVKLVCSRAALEEYLSETAEQSPALWEACERYDEAYFEINDLLLTSIEERSGSIRHEILSIYPEGENRWIVNGTRTVPEIGTADMAQWLILIETEKGLVDTDDTVLLNWKSNY